MIFPNARIYSLLLFLLIFSRCATEKNAVTSHPRLYNKLGVSFEYPRNWNVTEDYQSASTRMIYVESPGNAILFIHIIPEEKAGALPEFARAFAQSVRNGASENVIGSSTFGSPVTQDDYTVLEERFYVGFAKSKIAHQRVYKRKIFEDYAVTLIAQYSLEDRYQVETGFNLISSTFLFTP